jgi:mycothiol synthase
VPVAASMNAERNHVPFSEAHVPAFTAWFNALPDNNVWTEESVRQRTTQDGTYDPALMFAAVRGGKPVGFLLGSIANETGWIRAFLVRPDLQRQGIGTGMFDAAERAFAERGITEVNVGWAQPKSFLPGIDISYTSAISFLDDRGYQTNREARVNMDVLLTGRDWSTSADEQLFQEQGIIVRRACPADRSGIEQLCVAHNYHGWAVETGIALERNPVPVFVAQRQGRICAFAAHSICGPAHFGPMLTATEHRGLGIGTVLLKRCLQEWQNAGVERCEIVWAGPLSFYARSVGATMGRAFWTFHKSL